MSTTDTMNVLLDRVDRGRESQEFRYLQHSSWLESLRHSYVLDLGCGRGLYCRYLDANFSQVVGLDLSFESLKVAQSYTAGRPVPYCQGSGRELPFNTSTFDAVMCIETLSHVPLESQQAVVREINRVLRPGGQVIISVHNPTRLAIQNLARAQRPLPFYPNPGLTIYPIARRRLIQYFESQGFELVDRIIYTNLYNAIQQRFRAIFRSLEDGVRRVPLLNRANLTLMAHFRKSKDAGELIPLHEKARP